MKYRNGLRIAGRQGSLPKVSSQFALTLPSPPQVLQIGGRLYHLVLASRIARDIANCRVPSLHRRYSASSRVRTHPPPSRLRSASRFGRLYDLPCSGDVSPGRGGLLQLLGMSLPPCRRFHPAEVTKAVSVRFRLAMLPWPYGCGLGLRIYSLSRPHLRSLSLPPSGSQSPQGRPCR